ncbi:hypothetical protein ANN_09854 [Periplaneta americana]|uniref:Peptidase aspartic putative domain-containing protein n=1 Tax=Periplaneta americana TaxID=6978 RepID=A0ABQ8TNY4_PERAM|nr:hypothetical protein ANN_09854 [Periplaneta americana]
MTLNISVTGFRKPKVNLAHLTTPSTIHSEYDDDVEKCEEYLNSAKRAIQKASRRIGDRLSTSMTNTSISDKQAVATAPTQASITHSVRLPPIKLETFSGDVETWARFWEQFESFIDKDTSLSTINKHIFLRGYLEDEPKQFVDGISVIVETYEETQKILRTRYGDKNRIIQAHLDYMEDVKPIRIATPESLNTTYIECHRRVQALRALGEDVNGYGRFLAPKILRAFPDDICRRWIIHVKRENLSEGDILKLMEFLGEEVDGALTTQKIRGDALSSTYIPTTATLRIDTKTGSRSRHSARDCSRKGKALCTHCKMSHHRSICSNPRSTKPTTDPTKFTSVSRINAEATDFTYLQTAGVLVTGPTSLTKLKRCVLDGGSQSSFVTKSIVDELKLEVVDCRDLAIGPFESSPTTPRPRRLVRFSMKSIWTNSTASITGFESTHAFCPQPAVPHDVKMLVHTRKLQLADPKDHTEDMTLPIKILIGSDHYWKVVKDSSPIRILPTMVLIPSKLGWILSGNRSGITIGSAIVNYIHSEQGSDTSSDTFCIHHRDRVSLLEGSASKRQLLRVTSLQETMVKVREDISASSGAGAAQVSCS